MRINTFFSPPANRIVCHEVGHSVAVRHTSNNYSCMKRTVDGGTSQVLTEHDQGVISGYVS